MRYFTKKLNELNMEIETSFRMINDILTDLGEDKKWIIVKDVHINGKAGLKNLRLAQGVRLD